ncbi:MAG: YegP family protein [Gammaproteobacteria bacterium]|nr:YegP family protein [Gammaproteobacteria bacterium]MBU1530536.1 YegP family protein [Gammaproteobacteria bacterium]MBU2285753.1 YegP family protein [Gammaproteobacteria bacterium]
MAGWFEVSKSTRGQYFFVLKAGNAETILTSEEYTSKASADGGIAAVQSNCTSTDRYEKKTSSNGKPFFILKAANHQVIGTSQMYASEQSRDGGIEAVKSNGTTKTIKDNT